VRGHRLGGQLGRRPRLGGVSYVELRRIRVEAEADLAAALLYERREPVCERRRGDR
jgi:hypothetical protein